MMETMDAALKLFILGVTVSFGPCLAHCSLVILPYIAGTARGWKEGLKAILIFMLVRMTVYGIFGLLAGLIGRAIVGQLIQFEPQMVLVGGGFIAFLGLYIIFNKNELHRCRLTSSKRGATATGDAGETCGSGHRKQNMLASSSRHSSISDGGKGSALLGLFTGVLPCLPLLGVLAFIALYAQDLWQGAFYGMAFGSGKLISPLIPLAMLAGAAPALLRRYNRVLRYFTRLCGVVLLFIGVSLIIF